MIRSRLAVRVAVSALVLVVTSFAQAAPVYNAYFGSNPDAGGDITMAPAATGGRSTFLNAIDAGYSTETFESFSNGDTAKNGLAVFGGKGTLTSTPGAVSNIATDPEFGPTGRFNTTANCQAGKCNWWETTGSFTVLFGGNYSAFAFYGTDFADFGAIITLDLLAYNDQGVLGVVGSILVKDNTALNAAAGAPDNTSANSGALLHFGVTDMDRKYAGITMRIEQTAGAAAQFDVLGFDDLVVGNVKMPDGGSVPEPSSLALVGLVLAGVAATRRKLKA